MKMLMLDADVDVDVDEFLLVSWCLLVKNIPFIVHFPFSASVKFLDERHVITQTKN